ncbi:MAG: hypothetical protein LBE59_11165, partial [Nevskiaceae bacterium]|nr:hypothetical protein [Nevskiaceae bacterium]
MSEPTEQQLDEYLKGDSQVSRRYRELGDVEVPASLDRLVLNQAAEAVKRPARSVRPARPAWMRWTAPLAAAASLVLVVSVVFQTGAWRDVLQQQAPTVQVDQA